MTDTKETTLTREEILSLTGYNLSELVAEHVMEWTKTYVGPAISRIGSVWNDGAGKFRLIPHRQLRPGDLSLIAIVAEPWEPHTDIRAAWQVLDWIASHDRVHWNMIGTGAEHRVEVIADGESVLQSAKYTAFMAEEAICRVALLAVLRP